MSTTPQTRDEPKCVHCSHGLRQHRRLLRYYEDRAAFKCSCGCTVNGSVERIDLRADVDVTRPSRSTP